MSITIIKQPDTANYSKNPVPLAVQTSESNASILVGVFVDKDQHFDSSYEMKAVIDLTPDSDGLAYTDLSEILDAVLEYDMPEYNQVTAVQCRQVGRRFWLSVQEYVGGSLNSTTPTGVYHVFKGGIAFEEYPTAGIFSDDYFYRNKMFLSWLDEITVRPTQHHYLYFLNHSGGDIAQINLKAKIYYTDGTNSGEISPGISTAATAVAWSVWAFPAGYGQLGIGDEDPTRTVLYYEVWLENNAGGAEISKHHTFNVDHKTYRNERHYLYANSLGGVDSFYAHGVAAKEFEVESDEAAKLKQYWYTADEGMRKGFGHVEQQVIKAQTGYITADELEYLRDFVLSPCKLEIINAHHLEILLNKKTKVKYGENDNLRALAFEYNYNFTSEVYTPITLRNITPVSAPEAEEISSSSSSSLAAGPPDGSSSSTPSSSSSTPSSSLPEEPPTDSSSSVPSSSSSSKSA